MGISKPFLEKLLKKLKVGDTRGIHLNALPGNFARLDLYDLVNIEQSLHHKFLGELLSKNTFSFSITIDPKITKGKSKEASDLINKIIKRLNFMYLQDRDLFQEEGTKNFAFGYPILIKRDPNNPKKIIKAPIIIWYLEIEKDTVRSNTWKISRNEDHPVVINEALTSHLETTEKIKIDELQTFLEDGLIEEKEITNICHSLLEKLGINTAQSEELKILPCTNKESIEKLTEDAPWIRWSGVFGLFKAQKQAIIKDVESLLNEDYIGDNTDFISFQNEMLSPVPLDPSQEKVLYALKEQQKIIIQGPPGTGKSQTLTAIITNALLNGASCLVVGEKRTAMEVIYKHLKKIGLGELCVLIEDINANRKPIVERIRSLIEMETQTSVPFRKHDYETLKLNYLNIRKAVNDKLLAVETPFFGDDNLLEIITKFNKNNHQLNSILIKEATENCDIALNYENFCRLKLTIEKGEQLFRKYNQANPIYRFLPKKKFEKNIPSTKVFESINYVVKCNNKLLNEIENGIKDFGNDFDILQGFTNIKGAFLGVFSSRQKGINQLKSNCIDQYNQLKILFEGEDLFANILPNQLNLAAFSAIIPVLKAVAEKLSPIVSDSNAFESFYNYAVFIEDQEPILQQFSKHYLEKINPTDWGFVFEKWFLGSTIEQYNLSNQIDENTSNQLIELIEIESQLFPLISKKILFDWTQKREEILKSKDLSKIKQLYNYRKNKQFESRNSLRKIIFSDFDIFVTTFPVLMVSPLVASSILPLQENLFDIVLMDEASQLRIEDTFSALFRGKTKIISGDKHQMPPSSYFESTPIFLSSDTNDLEDEIIQADFLAESESLLEFAGDSDYSLTYLDFHYRSQHPDLINFSNAAFYNSRLMPMPEKEDYVPIQMQQVNGVYNKNGINEAEAAAIVNYLFEEIEIEDGVFPSIGVATLNLHQRNYIWELVMEQSYESKEKANHFEQLIGAGLFVKNLENIQGDERDYILLSTTFGPDADGKFRAQIGPLAQAKGYQLLNVIITRAKKAIQIFTSIPEPIFTNFFDEIKEKGNTGKAVFYAYLSYAKAIAEGNMPQKTTIINVLKGHATDIEKIADNNLNTTTIFKYYLTSKLKTQFADYELEVDYPLGGLILDIAFIKDQKLVLALVCEGNNAHFMETAYRNTLFKNQVLLSYNLLVIDIWSYNWNKDQNEVLDEIKIALSKSN